MVCSDVYWRGVKRDAIWLGPIGPPNLENKYIWWIIVGSVWKCFKQGVGAKLSCRPNAKWVLSSPAPNSHSWLQQLKVHRDTSRDKMCWLLGPFRVSSERNLMQTPDFGSHNHMGSQSQGKPAPRTTASLHKPLIRSPAFSTWEIGYPIESTVRDIKPAS